MISNLVLYKKGVFELNVTSFVVFVLLALVPFLFDIAITLDISAGIIFALLALSMGFLWGYVGILSFGQTIFFGLAGYVYAVSTLSGLTSYLTIAIALLFPFAFSLLLAYFIIYGRLSDIYLSIMTLVVTLILEKIVLATSAAHFTVGGVRLNGSNGIPGVPSIDWHIFGFSTNSIEGIYYLALVMLLAAYLGLSYLIKTRYGLKLLGVRENEQRMNLLGYDSRRLKLSAFAISSVLASLAGILFAAWGSFVGPEMFSLTQASMIVIWVIVGGRNTLLGPIIGAILIHYITSWLGTAGVGQVNLLLGFILLLFVIYFPLGIGKFVSFTVRPKKEIKQ
ncbi:MAG: branched-chain amino acid ABC transporter permease [Alcaligenaceae bacterium]|nr:branched-chain amino acid ABC transporter permease [Alcaligenaceae bacterium]